MMSEELDTWLLPYRQIQMKTFQIDTCTDGKSCTVATAAIFTVAVDAHFGGTSEIITGSPQMLSDNKMSKPATA